MHDACCDVAGPHLTVAVNPEGRAEEVVATKLVILKPGRLYVNAPLLTATSDCGTRLKLTEVIQGVTLGAVVDRKSVV